MGFGGVGISPGGGGGGGWVSTAPMSLMLRGSLQYVGSELIRLLVAKSADHFAGHTRTAGNYGTSWRTRYQGW